MWVFEFEIPKWCSGNWKRQTKKVLFATTDLYLHYKTRKSKDRQPYDIVVSKVIHNSYNVHENYLTLNSGALQGVESDMGVINNLDSGNHRQYFAKIFHCY
jgi:hypothetical protein